MLILFAPPAGAERLHFKVGPFAIEPGQNNIANRSAAGQQPSVNGWIVGIRPNLEYANGKTPGVDVIHLHHAVWLNLSAPDPTAPQLPERFFAVGEEKTNMLLPAGYGYPYKTTDRWLVAIPTSREKSGAPASEVEQCGQGFPESAE